MPTMRTSPPGRSEPPNWGTVLEVFTRGDKGLRSRAAEILKTAGGWDVIYRSPFITEYM